MRSRNIRLSRLILLLSETRILSRPAEAGQPEVQAQLRKIINEVKEVDNRIIKEHVEAARLKFADTRGFNKRSRARWDKLEAIWLGSISGKHDTSIPVFDETELAEREKAWDDAEKEREAAKGGGGGRFTIPGSGASSQQFDSKFGQKEEIKNLLGSGAIDLPEAQRRMKELR